MKGIASLRPWLAAALMLPLVALGLSWAVTYRLAQQGQEWLVPIRGYDPRDLLRGHYVQYQYDWPVDAASSENGDNVPFSASLASQLCIEGTAPDIARVRELPVVLGRPDPEQARGCAIIVRSSLGARREVRGLGSGILFTSQTRALALSRQLTDSRLQGFVRVRIRPDGVMRPVDIEFRPRGGGSMGRTTRPAA
ncbi:GDYXXLXY domain-containing protein [Sphingobium sp. JS3065]|uniref:GDYXXLXY domain-containing protein n=1 Tax=Sphingobium sp. JS3065 TaxID=2970925 RepID=UPI002264CC01|nr:GDYXXLXY domain-containing protein [Sphingobium sp. JS3065]UZW57028.1 GDYXXLXY domain-containing protein [Sphingobium sp. JS3065]